MTSTNFTLRARCLEKGDKAGKPHAHLESVPATTVWKRLFLIPSHIPKSNKSVDPFKTRQACFVPNEFSQQCWITFMAAESVQLLY